MTTWGNTYSNTVTANTTTGTTPLTNTFETMLRFIADNLDCNVNWNDINKEATTPSEKPAGFYFIKKQIIVTR